MAKDNVNANDLPVRKLRASQALYPVIIGLGVVAFLLIREFNPNSFAAIQFSIRGFLWIALALVLMVFRDVGYMLRLRILAAKGLSWFQTFRVIMLWEFTSAITPSAIGGTSVAIVYINKEGVSVGKSTAVVLATSFLDELYFILAFPLLLLLVSSGSLFSVSSSGGIPLFSNELFLFAIIGYGLKFVYVAVLSYGLFIHPRGLKWLIIQVFKLPFLRKRKEGALKAGNEVVECSHEFRKRTILFWLKAFGATALSWTSRFGVVNCLLMAFFATSEHFLVFARQLGYVDYDAG